MVSGLSEQGRDNALREYANNPVHKAQAVSLDPAGYWTDWGWATRQQAADGALEGCQVWNGHPCALIIVDDVLEPNTADGKLLVRDMPRAHFAGSFDPAQIPQVIDGVRQRTDVVFYSNFAGPKAASYHPERGRLFINTGGDSQRAVEEAALKACNDDTTLKKLSRGCFLYAVGNRVVLPLRLTEPLTPAAR
jgi:hypothetical protein